MINSVVQASSDIINASPGGIQFFDRDTNIDFSSKTPQMLEDFVNNPDVDNIVKELEALRIQVFENSIR